jgi:RecA-family ATPase
VPGLLPKGVCGFIYGEGGSYKSLAALWLCVQRAAGYVANSKWLDRFEICGAGRSMFCSIEDQILDLHHRSRAVVNRFCSMRSDVSSESITNAVTENFHIFPRERWMEDKVEHIVDRDGNPTFKADLVARYAVDNGIDLIILDTLSRLSLVDENDNNAGARLVSALERIRDISGATVLVIAHSGKAGRTGKTDTHGQNSLRGASALMDNARFGLWFRSINTKGKQERLEIINSKTFRAMRAEPFKIVVDYPAFTLLEDEAPGEDDLMPVVVEDVRANPGTTQHGTRTRLKKKQNVISQAYRDAIEEGLIICKGGRGKKGGYSIV